MKFKSPTTEPVTIALTSGHTCTIPPGTEAEPDGAEIDARFHREAIARECIPAGMPVVKATSNPVPNRTEVITNALQVMLDGDEESDFKKDGTPDANAVSRRCGFKVNRDEVDAIWATLKESVT